MRLAAVVLPVVSILALIALVSLDLVIEWAPDSLEVEHVEVGILLHPVEQISRQLLFIVSERAHVTEVARVHIVGPLVTELGLVFLGVVEGLDAVVGLGTGITIWAAATVSILAHLAAVGAQWTALVFAMVEEALLLVVATLTCARLRLENSQI